MSYVGYSHHYIIAVAKTHKFHITIYNVMIYELNQYMITACDYYIIAVAMAHKFQITIYSVMIYVLNQYMITACGYYIIP